MKSTATCPYCPKVLETHHKAGDHMGPARLKAITANHIKAAHPEHYKPSAATLAKRKAQALAIPVDREPHMDPLEHHNAWMKAGGGTSPVEKPKRKWTRRTPVAVNASTLYVVKFCPECGCNLNIINEAIKMGRGQ